MRSSDRTGKEAKAMDTRIDLLLEVAREHQEREIAHAARMRRCGRPTTSLRRSLGHSIMRIGARLAAEPSLELARSR
jgi:hypothetical protein